MAAWQHRVARDAESKLHFVYARYDTAYPRYRCGMIDILTAGNTLDDIRGLVRGLAAACNKPIIDMTAIGFEGEDDEGAENDGDYGNAYSD